MNMFKTSIVIIMALAIALACVRNVKAQTTDDLQTYFSNNYAGISIKVNATQETVPGENLTITLWLNITAEGFKMENLSLNVYGFQGGKDKIPLNAFPIIDNASLPLSYSSEHNFTVQVPPDVWGSTYAELQLRYAIQGSVFNWDPSFSITIVRNVYYEQLQEDFRNLNDTYWELYQNYTALQGNVNELDNTRRAAVILGVTTAFFVATTVFMLMRKPKEPW